jgi:polysaccharide export outer membrane protein
MRVGFGLTVLLCAALAGCTLPRGAALQTEVIASSKAESRDFAHYKISRETLAALERWPAGKHARPAHGWLTGGPGGRGQVLAAGDVVSLAVWENGENKLLTTDAAPSVELQKTRVSASGKIFVPYIGEVEVAGLSPEAARARIEERLTPLIPAAQVQLEAEPGRSNSVDLIGGVAQPGNFPMQDRSLTALGLISLGGGPRADLRNPQLRLLRAGKVYETSMARLLERPGADVGLRAGDKLIVREDPRYFLALGASGKEEIIPFPQDELTALEAITLAGGLTDTRANPRGLLVLREYPASAVRADGMGGPDRERVIFSLDLTTSDGLFSAQNFRLEPRDLVLATESGAVSLRTMLGLMGTSVGVANAVAD